MRRRKRRMRSSWDCFDFILSLGLGFCNIDHGEWFNIVIQGNKTNRDNLLAAVSYLFGFLSGFVVLFVVKDDSFVRFHALQSVMTFLSLLVVTVVLELIPGIGAYLGAFVVVVSFGVWLFLIVAALQGKKYKLPWIGKSVERQLMVGDR